MTDIFTDDDVNDLTKEIKFEDLVGEGKKFRDPDAVAKKVLHADQHIEKLETELSELRTDLSARLRVEEMLDKLKTQRDDQRNPADSPKEPGSKKEVDIAAEVQRLLKEEKSKETREGNLLKTRAGLKERFGADYNQRLIQIAEELSVSKDFLSSIATTSPEGFFKLVDSVASPDPKRPVTPPNPSRDPLKGGAPVGTKNNAYYQALRREKPDLYFSRKIQNEMHAEIMRQGRDTFFNQ